jgi:recombinational DNA repair protein (RecF pathway)
MPKFEHCRLCSRQVNVLVMTVLGENRVCDQCIILLLHAATPRIKKLVYDAQHGLVLLVMRKKYDSTNQRYGPR